MIKGLFQKILPVLLSGMLLPAIGFTQELDPAQWPSLVGYWQFQDTSNLTQATVGDDLVLVGSH